MLYTVTKKLNSNDAARIKEAERILSKISQLNDRKWLLKDVAFYKDDYAKKFGINNFELKKISKSLGTFTVAENRGFTDLFFPNTRQSCKLNCRKTLFLNIIAGPPFDPLGLIFSLNGGYSSFTMGPFYPKRDNYGNLQEQNSVIFEITSFFFTSPYQYQAVYNCLVKYKEEFSFTFGKTLIEDFILLFSAPIQKREIQNFDFALEEIKKPLFCQSLTKNDISWSFPFFSGHGEGFYKSFIWWAPELDAHIYLDNTNLLTIESRFTDREKVIPFCTSTEKFLTVRINDTLKQMVGIANFAKEIYSKVNNKIFLDNFQ